MKKLIAILSSVAIVLSLSVTSFAATATTTYVDADNEGGDNGYGTFTTVITGSVGSQATILAVQGSKLTIDGATNNIQYINQETAGGTTTFTYKLKDRVVAAEEYTVMVGGSDLSSAVTTQGIDADDTDGKYIPISSTQSDDKITITGKITGVAEELDTASFDFLLADPETEAPEIKAELDEAWKTKIELMPYDSFVDAAKNYVFGDVNELTVLATAYAEIGTGEYTLPDLDLEDGDYMLQISRVGYLSFFKKITVVADSVGGNVVDDIALLPGDTYVDGSIDSTDKNVVFVNQYFAGDSVYRTDYFSYDVNTDGFIDSTDVNVIFMSIGRDYFDSYDLDGFDYFGVLLGMY